MANLIDKRGAAKMLNCSVRQVDYLRQRDGLPFIRVGGAVKFRPEAIREWKKERE